MQLKNIIFVVFTLLWSSQQQAYNQQVEEKLNIIFLMVDDMRYNALSYTGQELAYISHIEEHAEIISLSIPIGYFHLYD